MFNQAFVHSPNLEFGFYCLILFISFPFCPSTLPRWRNVNGILALSNLTVCHSILSTFHSIQKIVIFWLTQKYC